jgi:hypothetical protein
MKQGRAFGRPGITSPAHSGLSVTFTVSIFLEDGCSFFKCQINLFELGKILFCEVLNFVEGRLRSTLEIAS